MINGRLLLSLSGMSGSLSGDNYFRHDPLDGRNHSQMNHQGQYRDGAGPTAATGKINEATPKRIVSALGKFLCAIEAPPSRVSHFIIKMKRADA
jgi:hypothetical protein